RAPCARARAARPRPSAAAPRTRRGRPSAGRRGSRCRPQASRHGQARARPRAAGAQRLVKRRLRFLWALRVLPPRVALFQWRAMRLALRTEDGFSVVSRTRPENLRVLLSASRGRRRVVELGTGTAWTSISLLLADKRRELVSY